MDVQDQDSVDAAIARIAAEQGRLDVVVHNAGHMVLGPAEAFTPEQTRAALRHQRALRTQRVNRAALPHRCATPAPACSSGSASSSTRGGHPPFLAPYFAAKAAMDALADSYAAEVDPLRHRHRHHRPRRLPHRHQPLRPRRPARRPRRAAEYDAAYGELRDQMADRLAALFPAGRTVDEVADAIVAAVALPAGQRPFRIHIDPSRDGSDVVSTVSDRIRAEFYHRIGIADLLTAHASR